MSRRNRVPVMLQVLLIFLALSAGACDAHAVLKPSWLFTDNAVLQRDLPLPVWGKAAPGETVTVSLDGKAAKAAADTAGRWKATLPPHPAGGPYELTIAGTDTTIHVKNVLVGDVWLCSGQSNMAFFMKDGVLNAQAEIAAANDSLLRHFFVSHRDLEEPVIDLREGNWDVCSPKTAGRFSGVAYYFGKELREKTGVPIGLLNAAVGSTKAEKWIGGHAMADFPELQALVDSSKAERVRYRAALEDYKKRAAAFRDTMPAAARVPGKRARKPPIPPHNYPGPIPGGHYNGMIAPLVSFPIKGVIWYQGESNADDPDVYRTVFPLLIKSWRTDWHEEFPFLYVQLANYQPTDTTRGHWADLREVQTETLSLPGTGMALAIDVGESHDIHPKDKKTVGHRLALLARSRVYGETIESSGPVFRALERKTGAIRLRFDHADRGLASHGGGDIPGFTVIGPDGAEQPVQALIEGGREVVLTGDAVATAREVRYGWSDNPVCNLYNEDGLPARPFRAPIP